MQVADLAKKYLRELATEWGGDLHDYFGLAYLEKTLGLSREEARIRVLFGTNQTGLGGFHYAPETRNLYLFVFLCDENPLGFQRLLRTLLDNGLARIFHSSDDAPAETSLVQLRSCILENRHSIQQVFLRCVYDGDESEASRSELLGKLAEDLSSKRHILDTFFGRNVDFVVEWRSSRNAVGKVVQADKTHCYRFRMDPTVEAQGPSGEQLRLGFVPLVDILAAFEGMRERFLERNIRFGLGQKKHVNRVLRSAFEAAVRDSGATSQLFVFHHNGVTLAAEKAENQDGVLMLTEPRLLNGAQTLTTFHQFYKDLQDKGLESQEDTIRQLEQIRVPCKLVLGCGPSFVTAVTINNNRQTPVEPWELRANDEIQLGLQDKFRRELGLYYERQSGALAALDEEVKQGLGLIDSRRAIELRKLAYTLLVAEGRLNLAKNLREVFQQDDQYRTVFRDGLLAADSRIILLCYKIHFRLRRLSQTLAEAARKYEFAPKARPLLWALLCQALLNDERIDEYKQDFGSDLVVKNEFVDRLDYLTRNRCRYVISDLLAEGGPAADATDGYQNFVQNFNSNQAFRKCMQSAGNRWGWSIRKLA